MELVSNIVQELNKNGHNISLEGSAIIRHYFNNHENKVVRAIEAADNEVLEVILKNLSQNAIHNLYQRLEAMEEPLPVPVETALTHLDDLYNNRCPDCGSFDTKGEGFSDTNGQEVSYTVCNECNKHFNY